MAKRSFRNRESKSEPRLAAERSEAGGDAAGTSSLGESPNKLMLWLWGVPIALITLAVVLKVTGVS